MFVVLLRFAAHKDQAPQHMSAHNAWLRQGFDEGVFLLAGSLAPGAGGAILAAHCSAEALEARIAQDPFVVAGVVAPEVVAITPGRTDPRLAFLAQASA
ncbi:YciI family protein [Niveibacterium sp. SC-1]|uniref:YciI family protein n=1 Tax=Niveibacterium sp. SC-1 TaxID=3135646 RepID=UPI00311FA83E